jgi:hypothetical protein
MEARSPSETMVDVYIRLQGVTSQTIMMLIFMAVRIQLFDRECFPDALVNIHQTMRRHVPESLNVTTVVRTFMLHPEDRSSRTLRKLLSQYKMLHTQTIEIIVHTAARITIFDTFTEKLVAFTCKRFFLFRLSRKLCSCWLPRMQNIQDDSKLLSGFPWPIFFQPERIK